MRRRPGSLSITANPVLVGAVTVLVVVVAVFLAYNANNGLPFVPSRQLTVSLPDADRLLVGNEVRMGGQRVGIIKSLSPQVDSRGRVSAKAVLSLETGAAPFARDMGVRVRLKSPLGLKYLELTPGTAPGDVKRLDRRHQARPVELDQVLNTFDARTRRATQGLLHELGGGLAGRGPDLNLALSALPRAARGLARVTRGLARPSTDLGGFVVGLADITRTLAPVAPNLARTFAHLNRTLEAVATEHGSLDATLRELPPTEVVGTRAFAVAAPVLSRTARLARALRGATPLLRPAAGRLADVTTSAPARLRASLPLSAELSHTFTSLDELARRPATLGAARRLQPVVRELRGLLPDILPFQIDCNYLGLWMRNVDSGTTEGDRNGKWFRFAPVAPVDEMLQQPRPVANLHVNPYPTMRTDDCEAGNEPYLPGRRIGTLPGNQGPTELTSRPASVRGR
ncbi:MlaD family protein [Paraconexibacter antarcticus]|uniref:MlaD family protein n=1 Tax=Paraconexibacter antarcticus TaxID=2949664 RepID=A0ABY5DZ81_9ACTN|nr:MlaD family protein [Paraconexibacter antarcticus]UTI66182.1 MlaD family protein [Paraconexibacter antarcticus]